MDSESVGEISRPERKLILGGSASRTLRNSFVTSREVTHATTSARTGKWLVRAIQSLNRGMSHSGRVAISLPGEQFWGRAVQASRDSLDPGRFLFAGSLPKSPKFPSPDDCAGVQRITLPGRLKTSAFLHSFPTTSCDRRRPESSGSASLAAQGLEILPALRPRQRRHR